MRPRILIAALLLSLASPVFAQVKTEFGELNHARFRIDVPESWNHGLVVYCHGYETEPVTYEKKDLPPEQAVFVDAGYALIQSGYSAGGWAVEQAVPETEALRRYFVEKYGQPKEVFVTGHSMGGFLTMELVEKYPDVYDGGLALCGPLAPAAWFLQRFAFDTRVIFDAYFPGALPSPAAVPDDYQMSDELTRRIQRLLDKDKKASAELRRLTGDHNNHDLADGLVFATYVLKDLERRAGGNPFDNHDTIYTGTADDNSVNDRVQRYTAVPGAFDYLVRFYTPTGHLSRPLLAVHTTYDPIVSPRIPDDYALLSRAAASGSLFVQQYVKHDGHCNITPDETAHAFSELRDWKRTGHAPAAGWLH